MSDDPEDLRNTRVRLLRLAGAAAIGAPIAVLSVLGMVSTGRGPNADPVGSSSVVMLGIAIFVVVTSVAHTRIARRPPDRR